MNKNLILSLAYLVLFYSLNTRADIVSTTCQEHLTLSSQGKYEIPYNCEIMKSIKIQSSDVELDCNNNTLNGNDSAPYGLFIGGTKREITNINVTHCNFSNFKKNAIRISSGISMNKWGENHQINYSMAPSNIKISNSKAAYSGGVGIYVDSYAHDMILDHIASIKSQGVGIYLEQATKNVHITNSKIIGNGVSTTRKSLREGIAIDSSANNFIHNNVISSNAAGGIFLYKNCGEKISSNKSTLRWQSADKNIISSNLISTEKVGIWVASRQRKNLSRWDCGDKSIDNKGKYFQDYANNNIILNNEFNKTLTGVIIEGSFNTVTDNTFIDSPKAIEVPTQDILNKTKYIPKGNAITGNKIRNSFTD